MALSKEVEIILKANAAGVKTAFDTITTAAAKSTDDALKDTLNSYATKVADSAATVVERVLDKKNFSEKLGNKLREQIERGSSGILQGIQDATDLAAQGQDSAAAAKLKSIRDQMQALEKMTGEDFQEAIKIGVKDAFSMSNLRDATGGLADLFEKSLNSVDVNDLGGLSKSIGGALSRGLGQLGKGYKAEETAALAAGDAAAAAKAGEMAMVMAGLATAVAGVAAAFALFIAYAKAADDYQAKLNKTLLNGAGVADIMGVAYQEGGRNLLTMTDTMGAARKASVETAVAFKMTTDETAGVLQELNSAGITYKRIIDGAATASEAQSKLAAAISQTITYASLLGVSVSELAQYQNTLTKDVNMSLDRTFDVFQAINDAAKASSMTTKTFFTAISQATSGMALYNVRVDQAIGLIKNFSKIVGETDAGKVFGELTGKKGVEERLRISATAIEAVGLGRVQDLFRRTTEAGATEFQKNFAKYGDEIRRVFADAGVKELGENLMSSDAATRAKATTALATLPDDIRERIKAGMENIEGGAASRSFGAFALSAKGQVGGINDVAGVMNQLDYAGKILMMDYQASILEKSGDAKLEDATSKATLQQFLGALGLDENQLEPILRYRQYAAALDRVRQPGTANETDKKTLESLGFTVEGDKVTKDGEEIRNLADIVYGLNVNMESADAAEARRDAVEKQRMQGTITDALNAWVQGKLFESALAPTGLLGNILKWVSQGAFDPEKAAKDRELREREFEEASRKASEARKAREEAQRTSGGEDTPEVTTARRQESQATYNQATAQVRAALGDTSSFSADRVSTLYGDTEYGRGEGSSVLTSYKTAVDAYSTAYAKYKAAKQQARIDGAGETRGPGGRPSNPDNDPAVVKAKKAMDEAGAIVAGLAKGMSGVDVTPTIGEDGVNLTRRVQDAFISKDGQMYHGPSADNILMFKDGGPLDPRTGGGGGGNVVININGGDQAMVYRTVARAMRAAQA